MNIRPQVIALSRNHFAFSPAIAFFLHSARNFLRALPCNPLASASLEHSRDSAVRGLAIFGAWVAPSLLVAGAVAVWRTPDQQSGGRQQRRWRKAKKASW